MGLFGKNEKPPLLKGGADQIQHGGESSSDIAFVNMNYSHSTETPTQNRLTTSDKSENATDQDTDSAGDDKNTDSDSSDKDRTENKPRKGKKAKKSKGKEVKIKSPSTTTEDEGKGGEVSKKDKKKAKKGKDKKDEVKSPSADTADEVKRDKKSKKDKKKANKRKDKGGDDESASTTSADEAKGDEENKKDKGKRKRKRKRKGKDKAEKEGLAGEKRKRKKKGKKRRSKNTPGESDEESESEPGEQAEGMAGLPRTSEKEYITAEVPAPQLMARLDNVEYLLRNAEGYSHIPNPAWSRPQVEAAVFVLNQDGSPDLFPAGPNLKSMDERVLGGVLRQFSSVPIERIHHYALNGEFLYALFKDRKLIDVLIHIDNRTFYAHRCVLCTHSGYFSNILINNAIPPYTVTDVTMKSVDPYLFKRFLHFAYTGELYVSLRNLTSLKRLAYMMKSTTLRAKLMLFMCKVDVITLEEALDILCNHRQVPEKPVAIETVKSKFQLVLADVNRLVMFSVDDFQDIISASNVCVNSELDIFWAVLFWIAADPGNRVNHLTKLMSEVRFTNMSSLELLDCAKVSELVRLSPACKKMLFTANWVCHAREMGFEDPLGVPQEPPRISLEQHIPCEPSVEEFDTRFLTFKNLMQRSGDNIILPPTEIKPVVSFIGGPDDVSSATPQDNPHYGASSEAPGSSRQESGDDVYGAETSSSESFGDQTQSSKYGTHEMDSSENKAVKSDPDSNKVLKESPTNDSTVTTEEPFSTSSSVGTTSQGNLTSNKKQPAEEKEEDASSKATDVSRNARSVSTDLSEIAAEEPALDPLQLWESSISKEACLLGGNILQPIRLNNVNLTRSRPQDQPIKARSSNI